MSTSEGIFVPCEDVYLNQLFGKQPAAFDIATTRWPEPASRRRLPGARDKGYLIIERELTADTLAHILEDASPRSIDPLKVDAEGYERRALR
jgi:hypothetical protein